MIALNAMAARFITISYVNEDYKKANMYYNSVFWGNLIIDAVLLLPVAFFIGRIEYVINVPENLVWDVRILFGVILLSFFVRTGAPNYDCGTYVTNRMDLSYIPSMATALLRCVMLFGMFSLLAPHVWYVGFTSMIISFITLGVAGHFTHKLTPELKVVFKKTNMFRESDKGTGGLWNMECLCDCREYHDEWSGSNRMQPCARCNRDGSIICF